jgi:hypothetical protein
VRLPQQRAEDVPFVVDLRDGGPGLTLIEATSSIPQAMNAKPMSLSRFQQTATVTRVA